jgi:predicted DNA-binding WGR domain protein
MSAVHLSRIDPARNMCRFYRLDVQPDLFGGFAVVKEWVRIGARAITSKSVVSRDTQPACSCLQLAVATNSLRRGLSPPIQGPCLAHQGCSLRLHRLRRLKPLTLTLSPAVHSAMPSMLHCCTSDLKRR